MKTLCNSLLTDGAELKQNRNIFPQLTQATPVIAREPKPFAAHGQF